MVVRASYQEARPGRALDPFFFEQGHEFSGCGDFEEATRHVRFLAELGNFPKHRQILIGYFEGRCNDQEEEIHRFVVDRLEVYAVAFPTEGDAQPIDDQRAAVGNGDAAANPG